MYIKGIDGIMICEMKCLIDCFGTGANSVSIRITISELFFDYHFHMTLHILHDIVSR